MPLLAILLTSSILLSATFAQSPQGANESAPPAKTKPAATPARSAYHPSRFPKRAGLNYALVWGVDSLSVKWAESGEIIRFSYRVLDADKAKALNDKKAEPSLIDPQAGVSLVVPSLEQVGQLRQSADPETGKVLLDGVLEQRPAREARRSCQCGDWAI